MKIRYKAAGYVRNVPDFVGRRLVARGIADLADGGQVFQERGVRSAAPVIVDPFAPDLDAMDAEALHALAKERGVQVHHRAGAEKVRVALREAEK